MSDTMRFYVDSRWRIKEISHVPLLYPFWGMPEKGGGLFHRDIFHSYPFDTSAYGITENIDEADMILFPYRQVLSRRELRGLYQECLSVSERHNLPLLVDGTGDIEYPVIGRRVIVLRYGGYGFLAQPNEVRIPPYADDLLERFYSGTLQIRGKTAKPTVSFAGWSKMRTTQRVRYHLKQLPIYFKGMFDDRYLAFQKGVLIRRKAIRALTSRPDIVRTNIIERASYSGHTKTAEKAPNDIRLDFVRNIIDSDYVLCVRGDANESVRFYEALSLGRIPLLVHTESILPFESKVEYKQFIVQIDFRELESLPEYIARTHATISEEKFQHMQEAARQAFVEYFRTDHLIHHIIRELLSRITIQTRP